MAPSIKRILCATDFSACAERALDYAVSLAASWKAELCVMTVLELCPGMDPEYAAVNKMYLDHMRGEATRRQNRSCAHARVAG